MSGCAACNSIIPGLPDQGHEGLRHVVEERPLQAVDAYHCDSCGERWYLQSDVACPLRVWERGDRTEPFKSSSARLFDDLREVRIKASLSDRRHDFR